MSRITKAALISNNIDKIDESQVNLIKFLKPFEINDTDDNYKENRNIFNPAIKKSGGYNIPFKGGNQSMGKFMKLLENTRRKNVVNHFMEMQVSNHTNNIGSGIMLDFDLLFESDDDTLIDFRFDKLVHEIILILIKTIDFSLRDQTDYEDDGSDLIELGIADGSLYPIWSVIIKRQNIEYKDDKKLYKNSFHLLFPNIKLSKETKRYIISKICESSKVKSLFTEIGTVNNDFLDRNSSHVPNCLFGSCKLGSNKPHLLFEVYKTVINNEAIVLDTRSDLISFENVNVNLCYEFSLNYVSTRMPVMRLKKYFKPRIEIESSIAVYNEQTSGNGHVEDIEEVLSELNNQISLITVNNCEVQYIKELLESLSIDRINDYNEWRNIIFAIANTSKQLKPLAEWISRRSVEKFNDGAFNLLWEQAVVKKSDRPLSIRSIIHWARIDNKERFEDIKNKSVKQLIFKYCSNQITSGLLGHFEYSQLLYTLFKEKYVTDYKSKSCVWFKFITPSDTYKKGELYKWVEIGSQPRSLSIYISEKLKDLIEEEIGRIQEEIQKADTKELVIYFENKIKNLITSGRKLSDGNFKNNIFKETGISFECRNFIRDLNKDQHILGVENGILVLNEFDKNGNPRLIAGPHEYKISVSCPTSYYPYDLNNKYIQKVEELLKAFYLPEEMDSYEFMMYYLASCLDGLPKDNIIFILLGGGCHAIDTPILMFDESIKMVQDIKVNDKIMGDDFTPRTIQELFTGTDTMVQVSPKDENSFVVNINHVLSLKFSDNLINMEVVNGLYKVSWYEYGSHKYDEPIKKIKYINPDELKLFINTWDTTNIITNNKPIDIKICDLLKWDKTWMTEERVNLYKNTPQLGSILYGFDVKLLGKDTYYGFELDNNHRYCTADHFVHHNSNGKTALVEFILSVLGESYAIKMSIDFLTSKRTKASQADPSVMALEYARFVYYSESDADDKLSAAKMKEICGGETLSARQIFETQKNFKPNANHMVITNNRLKIDTTDHGTWRRIFYSELKIKFTMDPEPNNKYEKKVDTNFTKKYINDDRYREAFLSILVKYYVTLKRKFNGTLLAIKCPTIRRETQNYRDSEDVINKFITQCCVISVDNIQELTDVIEVFKVWHAREIGTKLTQSNSYLMDQLQNSSISKYIIVQSRGSRIVRNIRFIQNETFKEDNEKYLNDIKD